MNVSNGTRACTCHTLQTDLPPQLRMQNLIGESKKPQTILDIGDVLHQYLGRSANFTSQVKCTDNASNVFHPLLSTIHTVPEKVETTTITGHFQFVSEENMAGKLNYYLDVIAFEELHFQNFYYPH